MVHVVRLSGKDRNRIGDLLAGNSEPEGYVT